MKDSIGARLRSKTVIREDQNSITFGYKEFPLTMVWGPLERKPWQTAGSRYAREKRLSLDLRNNGLNVPEILGSNDSQLELTVRKLSGATSVLKWLPHLDRAEQLRALENMLTLLKAIHLEGPYHGDPYLKNFLVQARRYPHFIIYTTGLQYSRNSLNPQMTDLRILLANSISFLRQRSSRVAPEDVYSMARSTYGTISPVNLTPRDRFFYHARFGMDRRFFQFFERGY